jgi:DNA-binding NtrC family response regulator
VNSPASFLIVDDIDDNRLLLAKALLREFPEARVAECIESGAALIAAGRDQPTAIIVHRSFDLNGPDTIRALRGAVPDTPIIMVSGRESCPEGIAAGANAFLNYESWPRIGLVITEVLSPQYVKALTKTPFAAQGDYLGYRRGETSVNAS